MVEPQQQNVLVPRNRQGFWGCLISILLQRCPGCRRGKMFRGPFTMNDPCPVCGLLFQREEGSFLGSMYASYVLSSFILGVTYFVAAALLPGWSSIAVALVALIPLIPLTGVIWRYSRVLWVYLDYAPGLGDPPVGPYERARRANLARRGRN